MKRLLYLLILLNTSLFAQYSNTVYLDPTNSGDPSEDGSIDHPYDDIADVTLTNNTAYLFKRGTTMNSTRILLQHKKWIKIGAYGSGTDNPIFQHAPVNTQELVAIGSCSNIWIDSLNLIGNNEGEIIIQSGDSVINLRVSNLEMANGYCAMWYWIYNDEEPDTLTIENCKIHNFTSDGLMLRRTTNITIENCHIYDVNTKWFTNPDDSDGDCIHLVGNCNNYKIYNNILDKSNTGRKFCFIYDGHLEPGYVSGEIIGNTFIPPHNVGGSSAIYTYPHQSKIIVARNLISGRATEYSHPNYVPGSVCQIAADSIYFYYNVIDSMNSNGNFTTQVSYAEVSNNTLVSPIPTNFLLDLHGPGYVKVYNNLSAGDCSISPLRYSAVNSESGNNIEINSSNTSLYNSTLGITDWETGNFLRTSDLNDGSNVGLSYDYDSVYVNNPPEIGSCEYIDGTQSNNPPNINNQTFGIDENTTNGTQVGVVQAMDPDQGQSLTYTILSGNTDNAFQLNSATGELTVNNTEALNYEITQDYNLTIQVQDNGIGALSDQAMVNVELIDLVEPIANFNANVTIVNAGESISFQDESLNNPTDYIWQFDGGTPNTSFDQNPIVTYDSAGTYNVGLVVSNSNGFDIMIKADYITVETNTNPPVANFISSSTVCNAGEEIYFQDESLDLPTNWIWQFEGGIPNTSFEKNPMVTYNTPGDYNVKLVVSNSNGYDLLLKTDYIEVLTNENSPVANFIVNSTISSVNENVYFQDESLNFPTNWTWQFEGGSPSTSFNENPVISYEAPGTYNVKLVVLNSVGYDSVLKIDYIEILENANPPTANFEANSTIINAGGSIYFQDESLNLPTNWIWQFEGGSPNTSFKKNPVINYETPGIYNVKLVVSNSNGYDLLLKTDYIEVITNINPPTANFEANSTIINAGESIYFQDESLDLPTNWIWQFEGGSPNTSFNQNPVVAYEIPGIYNVKLVVSNSYGYDLLLKSDYIEVEVNTNPPTANFSANSTLCNAGESIYFQDESLDLPTLWEWEFEGGNPSISFEENPIISYETPGLYNVKLFVSNPYGDDVLIKTDYILVETVASPPIADFSSNTNILMSGELVYFHDESLNLPTNWIWQFEGGSPNTSFEKNPTVVYNEPGLYNVKLVVSNSSGYDMLVKNDFIEVQINNNPPIANFTANTTFVYSGGTISFYDESLNSPTNWIWQFEGGSPNTSFNENPIITYNKPGIYNVKLVASNPYGYDMLLKTGYIEVFKEKKGAVITDSLISNADERYEMSLYPNPTGNYINIVLPNKGTEKYSIKIYNLFGKMVKELEFTSLTGNQIKRIDLSDIQKGTYILHLEGNKTTERRKFIKY